jgi:hypothetical protein
MNVALQDPAETILVKQHLLVAAVANTQVNTEEEEIEIERQTDLLHGLPTVIHQLLHLHQPTHHHPQTETEATAGWTLEEATTAPEKCELIPGLLQPYLIAVPSVLRHTTQEMGLEEIHVTTETRETTLLQEALYHPATTPGIPEAT